MNITRNTHLMAESQHYQIWNEFEVVWLVNKNRSDSVIAIGDFYGEPASAIIDASEKFAIMVGCGLILYYLVEPFISYRYAEKTSQWVELFREEPDVWIESVTQKDGVTFCFEVDPNSKQRGLYQLTMPDLLIEKLR